MTTVSQPSITDPPKGVDWIEVMAFRIVDQVAFCDAKGKDPESGDIKIWNNFMMSKLTRTHKHIYDEFKKKKSEDGALKQIQGHKKDGDEDSKKESKKDSKKESKKDSKKKKKKKKDKIDETTIKPPPPPVTRAIVLSPTKPREPFQSPTQGRENAKRKLPEERNEPRKMNESPSTSRKGFVVQSIPPIPEAEKMVIDQDVPNAETLREQIRKATGLIDISFPTAGSTGDNELFALKKHIINMEPKGDGPSNSSTSLLPQTIIPPTSISSSSSSIDAPSLTTENLFGSFMSTLDDLQGKTGESSETEKLDIHADFLGLFTLDPDGEGDQNVLTKTKTELEATTQELNNARKLNAEYERQIIELKQEVESISADGQRCKNTAEDLVKQLVDEKTTRANEINVLNARIKELKEYSKALADKLEFFQKNSGTALEILCGVGKTLKDAKTESMQKTIDNMYRIVKIFASTVSLFNQADSTLNPHYNANKMFNGIIPDQAHEATEPKNT